MRIKFVLCFVLLAIASCKTADVMVEQDVKIQDLYGKWIWFQSSGGITGHTITPASTGNNDAMEISSSKIVKRYRNGILLSQDQYLVQKGTSIINHQLYYQLVPVNGGLKQSILKLNKDTLLMSDEANDGYTSAFVRQK